MPALKQTTRMLTLPQTAESLGVSVNTVRAWVYRRKIDFVKIGRSVRVSEATVEKIILSGTVPAIENRL
jgi:excisionase family DNA binding protein